MSRSQGEMGTYKVNLRRMEQLLFGVGTCRRICKSPQKRPISDAIHRNKVSYIEQGTRRGRRNTWRQSALQHLGDVHFALSGNPSTVTSERKGEKGKKKKNKGTKKKALRLNLN